MRAARAALRHASYHAPDDTRRQHEKKNESDCRGGATAGLI